MQKDIKKINNLELLSIMQKRIDLNDIYHVARYKHNPDYFEFVAHNEDNEFCIGGYNSFNNYILKEYFEHNNFFYDDLTHF